MGSAERRPASDEARRAEINDSIIPDVGCESQHADDPWPSEEPEGEDLYKCNELSECSELSEWSESSESSLHEQHTPNTPNTPNTRPTLTTCISLVKLASKQRRLRLCRFARQVVRDHGRDLELHDLAEIVRQAVEVPDGQAHEDVALEVAGYIADVKYPAGEGPFEQLLASGSISTPAEAARYESNPKLHRLVCVIPQLLTDDEGLITLHQQTIAGEFGCTQGLVSTMIKLLKLHGLLELVHKELPGMRCARYRRRYGDEEPATTADLNENDLPF